MNTPIRIKSHEEMLSDNLYYLKRDTIGWVRSMSNYLNCTVTDYTIENNNSNIITYDGYYFLPEWYVVNYTKEDLHSFVPNTIIELIKKYI